MNKSLLLVPFCLLSACTSVTNDQTGSVCRQLKSDIIFSGNTSNVRQQEIEKAERPLQQRTYNLNNCDE